MCVMFLALDFAAGGGGGGGGFFYATISHLAVLEHHGVSKDKVSHIIALLSSISI